MVENRFEEQSMARPDEETADPESGFWFWNHAYHLGHIGWPDDVGGISLGAFCPSGIYLSIRIGGERNPWRG